jgi:hypothetical protein
MTPGLAVYLAACLAIATGNALKGKWWMAVLFSAAHRLHHRHPGEPGSTGTKLVVGSASREQWHASRSTGEVATALPPDSSTGARLASASAWPGPAGAGA